MEQTSSAKLRAVPVPLDKLPEVSLAGKLTAQLSDEGFFRIRNFPRLFIKGDIIFVAERASGAKNVTLSINATEADGLRHALETHVAPLLRSLEEEHRRAKEQESAQTLDANRAGAVQLGASNAKRRKAQQFVAPIEIRLPVRADELRGDGYELVTLQVCKSTEILSIKEDTVTLDPEGTCLSRGNKAEMYANITASLSSTVNKIYVNLLLSRAIVEVSDEQEETPAPITFGGRVITFHPPGQ